MQEIYGGYTKVELRDGSDGNYEIAREYYKAFFKLEGKNPAAFKKLCAHVFANPEQGLQESHKAALVHAGLARCHRNSSEIMLSMPEREIKDFLHLAVNKTPLSGMFSFLSRVPGFDYKLASPFKKSEAGKPGHVAREDQTPVCMDWAGTDTSDYPGNKLFPNSEPKLTC